jgi:hypothetical protein
MLSVTNKPFMLSVIMLNVIMQIAVAPILSLDLKTKFNVTKTYIISLKHGHSPNAKA